MVLDAKGTVERLKLLFDDTSSEGSESPAVSNGRKRLLSPLEIHFSQSHIRPDFQDGHSVVETAAAMQAPEHRERLAKLQPTDFVSLEVSGVPVGEGDWWLLRPPFPEIEVIQWRCKLREEDGTLKLDEHGFELYGEREWYTLDNRRLYCLQRAAAALHPQIVRCVVSVIQQEEGSCREFRKFRTHDRGRSVAIGHRDSPMLPRWSWRKEAGLPEEVLTAGSTIAKPRRRTPNSGRGQSHSGGRRGARDDAEDGGHSIQDFVMNASIFILVYAALRLAFYAATRLYGSLSAETVAGTLGSEGVLPSGR